MSTPLPDWRRAVVKVGSNLIAPEGRELSTRHLLGIARFVTESRAAGRELVLVSSGAVAAGRALLKQAADSRSLVARQALAAAGQPRVMETWSRLVDFPCAQVLLAYDDLQNRRRFVNAKNTLRELLALGTLPVVNENDSVAVDELKLGDNDNLAAHVAVLVDADLLVILSDVDGLFDRDPRQHDDARLIARVEAIDDAVLALAGGAGSAVGTGGMRTKLEAAIKATQRGIATVIANGRGPEVPSQLARGLCPGTLFVPQGTARNARRHWLQHVLTASGTVFVDAGAARALRERGGSLLPVGVLDCTDNVRAGEAVHIVVRGNDGGQRAIGKGISQYDAVEIRRIAGRASSELERVLGYAGADTVVHRDDLVLF